MDNEIQVTSDWKILSRKQRDQEPPEPLHFKLRSVTLGMDEDGEPVTSAVVDDTETPAPRRKTPNKTDEIAMQALCEAPLDHGSTKVGNAWPKDRKVVELFHWRKACEVHGRSSGPSSSAPRTVFMRAKTKLLNMDEIREFGDLVWRVSDED